MNDSDHERENAKLLDGSYGVRAQYPELNADIDNHELPLMASGGWCAPSEVLYDLGYDEALLRNNVLEMITIPRGGLMYQRREFTEREEQVRWANAWLAEHSRHHVAAHIGDISMAQHDAIHAAVYWARTQPLAWSVHLHTNESSRFVGITLWPEKSGVSVLRTHALYSDDGWSGCTFDAEDWVEMFEDSW